ncbi:unnamed protein product [Bursaphelenchus okinawaensis]|uniref:EGF-like domain-containing protein n=1 Tax=Bursaphelenchus okinawaensis TaxID=465554 RepID=A0A811LL86_9BILA|nr:unnamed protein product [Bursaphelenchus okinawaensis]CAG9123766.1 unnamed protein product [Bursaphelenchus okinawaensis]
MNRYYVTQLLLLLLLIAYNVKAHEFHRNFRFKHNKFDEDEAESGEDGTKKPKSSKGVLRKLVGLPKVPSLPKFKDKRVIPLGDDEDVNMCLTKQPCLNDGRCIQEGNSYYCECAPEFYGTHCEFVADRSECGISLCSNNSICYSLPDEQTLATVENGTLIQHLVHYKCWCKKGFYGDTCDFTEGMRQCTEEQCNGHGIVNPEQLHEEGCKCHCEEYYTGDHCDLIIPCKDQECINGGKCENCEIIDLETSNDPTICYPCEGGGYSQYVECLKENAKVDADVLIQMVDDFMLNGGQMSDLETDFCVNKGQCNVMIGSLPISPESDEEDQTVNKLFVLPKCECRPEFEGEFCEKRRKTECEKLLPEERCAHGVCVHTKLNGIKCVCDEGYEGKRCELKNKCHPNPCGDATCVEITVQELSEDKIPICVCNNDQDVDGRSKKCTSPHFQQCYHENGTSKCGANAACYPCTLDNEKDALFDVCSHEEDERGFRCVCPPGLAQPFCQRPLTPCDLNPCKNGAICELTKHNQDGYTCSCKDGYKGPKCEQYVEICDRRSVKCVNGTCVKDSAHKRGYRCDCEYEFTGRNCDKKIWDSWMDKFHGRQLDDFVDIKQGTLNLHLSSRNDSRSNIYHEPVLCQGVCDEKAGPKDLGLDRRQRG